MTRCESRSALAPAAALSPRVAYLLMARGSTSCRISSTASQFNAGCNQRRQVISSSSSQYDHTLCYHIRARTCTSGCESQAFTTSMIKDAASSWASGGRSKSSGEEPRGSAARTASNSSPASCAGVRTAHTAMRHFNHRHTHTHTHTHTPIEDVPTMREPRRRTACLAPAPGPASAGRATVSAASSGSSNGGCVATSR